MTSHQGSRRLRLTTEQVLRYRARVSHLDTRLEVGAVAAAAWGGLQDTAPRAGVLALHARVEGTLPGTWEDPSLAQIWFRGGADYIVPRADVGVFTLGSYPRDPARAAALEAIADDLHRATGGAPTLTRDLPRDLGGAPFAVRRASVTGRVLIRWDASNTWVIPAARPAVDPEAARLELGRRFLHWLAPRTRDDLARWTGVDPRDARATWQALEPEMEPVSVAGIDEERFVLAADVEALGRAEPIVGVRLLPQDDPFTKLDHELLLADVDLRLRALPRVGASPGYIPGVLLVDGEVAGAWQRQGRAVTIHPFRAPTAAVRAAAEAEALGLPIAGPAEANVRWDPAPMTRRR